MEAQEYYECAKNMQNTTKSDTKLSRKCFVKLYQLPPELIEEKQIELGTNDKDLIKCDAIEHADWHRPIPLVKNVINETSSRSNNNVLELVNFSDTVENLKTICSNNVNSSNSESSIIGDVVGSVNTNEKTVSSLLDKEIKVKHLLKKLQFSAAGPKIANISNIVLETASEQKNKRKRRCASLVKYESTTDLEDITEDSELQPKKMCVNQPKDSAVEQIGESKSFPLEERHDGFRKKYISLKRHLTFLTGRSDSSGFLWFCSKIHKKFDSNFEDVFKEMFSKWVLLSEKKKRFYEKVSKQLNIQKPIGGKKFIEKMSLLVNTQLKYLFNTQKGRERSVVEEHNGQMFNISADNLQSNTGNLDVNSEATMIKTENFNQEELDQLNFIFNSNLIGADDIHSDETIKNNFRSDISLPPDKNKKIKIKHYKIKANTHHNKLFKQTYKCSGCQFSTHYKSKYYSHLSTHGRVLTCIFCSYKTIKYQYLIVHFRTMHSNEKPFKCKTCSYTTADRSHFTRHKRIHSGRPIFCVSCDYRCHQLISLKRHSQRHKGILMKCPFCRYETKNSVDLMNHYSEEERGKFYALTLQCSKCDFWCYEKNDLVNHIEENNCKFQTKIAKSGAYKTSKQESTELDAGHHSQNYKNNCKKPYNLRNRKKPRLKQLKIETNPCNQSQVAGMQNNLTKDSIFTDKKIFEMPIKKEIKQEIFENCFSDQKCNEQAVSAFLHNKEIKEEIYEEEPQEEFPPLNMGNNDSPYSWSKNQDGVFCDEDLRDSTLTFNITSIGIKDLTAEVSNPETEEENSPSLLGDEDSSSSWTEDHPSEDLCENAEHATAEIGTQKSDVADITKYDEFEKNVSEIAENNEIWRTIYITREINELGFEYYLCLYEFKELEKIRNKMIQTFLEQLAIIYLNCELMKKPQLNFHSIVEDHLKDIEDAFSEYLAPNILFSTMFGETSNLINESLQCLRDLIEKQCCPQHCRTIRNGKHLIEHINRKFLTRELQLKDKDRFLKAKICLVKNYVTASRYTMTVDLFNSLIFSTFCRLVIFNDCDPSALNLVTVEQWEAAKQLAILSPAFIHKIISLKTCELEMYNFFNVAMKICKKLILIPQPCVTALNLLSDPSVRQSVGVSLCNRYLFPSDSVNSICGYKCIDHFFENNFATEFHRNFITYNERLSVGALDIPITNWNLISESMPKALQNTLINCLPQKLNFIIMSCYSTSFLLSMDSKRSDYLGHNILSLNHNGGDEVNDEPYMTNWSPLTDVENDTSVIKKISSITNSKIEKEFENFENTLLNELENGEIKSTIFVTREILVLGFEFYLSLGKYGIIMKNKIVKVKNFMMQIAKLFINYTKAPKTQFDTKKYFVTFAVNYIQDLKCVLLSQLSSEIFYVTDECRYKRVYYSNLKDVMLQYLDNFAKETSNIINQYQYFIIINGRKIELNLPYKFCHRKLPIDSFPANLRQESKKWLCKHYTNSDGMQSFLKFKRLLSQTFYRLLLFNKCNSAALKEITLQDWETAKMKSSVSFLFYNLLTWEEQKIYQSFHVTIKVREKVILIPVPCVSAMNKICDLALRERMNVDSSLLFPFACIGKYFEDNYFEGFHESFFTCLDRWEFGLLDMSINIKNLIFRFVEQKEDNCEILDCLPNNLKFVILSCYSTTNLLSDIIERNSSYLSSEEKGITDYDAVSCQRTTDITDENHSEPLTEFNAQNKSNESVISIFNSNFNPLFQKFLTFLAETGPSADDKDVDILYCTRRLQEIGFDYFLTNNTSYGPVRCFMLKLASLYGKFREISVGADPEFEDMFDIKHINEIKDSILLTAEILSAGSKAEYYGILRSAGFYLASLLDPFDDFHTVKCNVELFNDKFDDNFKEVKINKKAIHLVHSPSFFYDQVNICEVKKLLEENYDYQFGEKKINASEFRKYEEVTFCRLILFNKCDPSLLSGLTVKQWKMATYRSMVSLKQLAKLERSELNMFRYFNTALHVFNEVNGSSKFILIPDPCVKVMNVLANSKARFSAQISPNNLYMFPSLDNSFVSDGSIDGQKYVNKFFLDNFGIEFNNCKLNDNDRMLVGLFNIPEANYNFIIETVASLKGKFLPKSIQDILIHNSKKETGHVIGDNESSYQKLHNMAFNILKSYNSVFSQTTSMGEEPIGKTAIKKDFLEFDRNILKKINNSSVIQLINEYKQIQEIGYQYYLCNKDIGDNNFEQYTKTFLEQLVFLFLNFRQCRKYVIFEDMFNINHLEYLKKAIMETSSLQSNKNEILMKRKCLFLHEVLKFCGLQLAITLSKVKPQHFVTFKVYEFNECFHTNFHVSDKTLPTIVGCCSYAEQSKTIESFHNDTDKIDNKYQQVMNVHEMKLVATTFWRFVFGLVNIYPSKKIIRQFLANNPELLKEFKSRGNERRILIIRNFLSNTRMLLKNVYSIKETNL